jgi:hypothetical protein
VMGLNTAANRNVDRKTERFIIDLPGRGAPEGHC